MEGNGDLESALKKYFKHGGFKSKLQKSAIKEVLRKKHDVYISMPTGSGKSLCFQLPAVMQPNKITLVFSPLLALIKDQMDHLNKLRLRAASLNSKMSAKDRQAVIDEIRAVRCEISFLYITPEQAATEFFKGLLADMVKNNRVAFVAVDEAHCVSEFGHDFRPDYLKLGQIRKRYPNITWIALTATAPKAVVRDIYRSLELKDPVSFKTPSFRSNLVYDVVFKNSIENDFQHLKDFIKEVRRKSGMSNDEWPCGIIYCRTRDSVERVAHALNRINVKTSAYHAGLSNSARIKVQEEWMSGEYPIMTATISFGMGVDKANVRFVVHFDISQNVAGYYQESGRAGRDGKLSFCRLYFCSQEVKSIDFLLKQDLSKAAANPQKKARCKHNIDNFGKMVEYAERVACRHKFLSNYFGDDDVKDCKDRCDVCLDFKKAENGLQNYRKLNFSSKFVNVTDDFSDLYGGGRMGIRNDERSYANDGSSSDDDGPSRKQAEAAENYKLIKRQLALRQLNATKLMEQESASVQISRVKFSTSTEVKISGLTNKIRDMFLTMITDNLKKNHELCAGDGNPDFDKFKYSHFEEIGREVEYECFTANKVLSLYRRSVAKASQSIKDETSKGQLNALIKKYLPTKSVSSASGSSLVAMSKRYEEEFPGILKEAGLEEEVAPAKRKRREHRSIKPDYQKQQSITSFITVSKKDSDEPPKKLVKLENDLIIDLNSPVHKGYDVADDKKGEINGETVVTTKESDEPPKKLVNLENDSLIINLDSPVPPQAQDDGENRQKTNVESVVIDTEKERSEIIVPKNEGTEKPLMLPPQELLNNSEIVDIIENQSVADPKKAATKDAQQTTTEQSKQPQANKKKPLSKEEVTNCVKDCLMPYYKNKQISNKDIFKGLARHLSHRFYGVKDKTQIKIYIKELLKKHRCIDSDKKFSLSSSP